MISDGAGFNTWLAASMYQGKAGKQVYDGPKWVQLTCTTYPLNRSGKPTGDARQDAALIYDPGKAWDGRTVKKKTGHFAGYTLLLDTCTDSSAAATAMATGVKTYPRAVNWTNLDQPLAGATIAEIAKSRGKKVGVVTSVPWSHATPAGLGGAHNVNRHHLAAIANEMLLAPWLDVIMGAGHPKFDDDGRPPDPASATASITSQAERYQYVGGQDTWRLLEAGCHPGGWKLIESKADFESLCSGETPAKVLGTARAATTLQQQRRRSLVQLSKDYTKAVLDERAENSQPYEVPLNTEVPSLAIMARGAINCLDDNPRGFYLMIEGGAVDWANHANEKGRMIEEQVDFVRAVEAVAEWIETHSSWDETLLILTADHETGLLWGPESNRIPFQPIRDRGAGRMPAMRYNSHGHTNSLVPLYTRGAGSAGFRRLVRGIDPKAAEAWRTGGEYIDNTDVFGVMKAAVEEDEK